MVTNQAYLFLIFSINGIIIGLLFDFFRILRRSFKTNDIITYFQDVLFWILTGFIILYSTFTFNDGEIRLFMLLGVIFGVIIYMLLVSKYIIKVNVAIITVIKKIVRKIVNILLIPFQFLFKIFRKIFIKPIAFLFINIRKNSTNSVQKVANCLKNTKKSKKMVKS